MKTIVRIFYVIGIIFWTSGLICGTYKLLALNGLGDIFEMKEAQNAITDVVCDSANVSISYTYLLEGKEYHDNYKMFTDYYKQCGVDTIIIRYNKTFPMISFIDGIPLKIKKQKIGIFISAIFLLFLILIWRLSSRNKWEKTYEEVGKRPWLYPADRTIKNPLIRFKSRLFR